ncbi:MAG: hypothetical protein K6E62_07655 [Lachnospiraceae bacterium]|nr:hypothetical protein [Lachnospiraceae bacterium]
MVNPHDFDENSAWNFYCVTKETLESMAKSRGISDLEKYYHPTDSVFSNLYNHDELSQVFCQLAFHAQNATMISPIVKFLDNQPFLETVLCNFNPNAFLAQYDIHGTDEENVHGIVEALRFNEQTGVGLRWSSEKSKEENKDRIMKSYAKALLFGARYIRRFSSKSAIVQDLSKRPTKQRKNIPAGQYKPIIEYFKKQIPSRFSVALTCDFLKELDAVFSDLPKPDVHIKDTLIALKKEGTGYYNTGSRGDYCCIEDMQRLTAAINAHLRTNGEPEITVYRLDRMIWLICSENFYLDTERAKSSYLKRVATL